ncbi:MAG: hypothetical protein LBS70_05330 [Candidatus Accumulibacter sp.]|jgi:hypothetical protein|nr:hypothetical protein [Accumulibacter sp.]
MNANDRSLFDFGGENAVFEEKAPGSWLDPRFGADEFMDVLERAAGAAANLAALPAELIRRGIGRAGVELAAWRSRNWKGGIVGRRFPCTATLDEYSAFVEICQNGEADECKLRFDYFKAAAAAYFRDAGTLTARVWRGHFFLVEYCPWRDVFFAESFLDAMKEFEAPYALWGEACCAQTLAYSGDGVARVPTFRIAGREYVNDGISSYGAYAECHGWTFRALADWKGPTYSHLSQCRAWVEGRTERGDRRGLVVMVRGAPCVLDGVVRVFDREHSHIGKKSGRGH